MASRGKQEVSKMRMFRRYKEIVYGLLFGLGAGIIDAAMHAQMENASFGREFIRPGSVMLVYRIVFVFFGLALGWLLWRKNERERDFRRLNEIVVRFHREIAAPALLMHTKVQLLLMRKDFRLPREAEEMLRSVYERSLAIQSLAKQKLPGISSS